MTPGFADLAYPKVRRLAAGTARALAVCIVAIATPLTSGCARNPVTGQYQLALISEGQEVEMGRQAAEEVQATLGLVEDAELQAYVSRLGGLLARTSERPNLPWSFSVIDDPTPNAFALPGGFIYVTRGMMALMSNEAQLVSVLGHEIGHVTARHHVTSMSRAQIAQIGLGVGATLFPQLQELGGVAGAGLQLLFLHHGRDAERQADELGFGYTLDHGFAVREMANVFASLERLGEREGHSPLPSWLLTHPAPGDRVRAVEARLAALGPNPGQLRIGTQEYLQRIDGLVYGENPRNGYFSNELFLHPDLRFQFRLPDQWQRQNLPQAVRAVSPQQNAAIQLTLAGTDGAEAAATAFLSQRGMRVGQSGRVTINGLPAVIASFQAQTQQQILQGLVVFIEHGGRTYQLVGYSPAAIYEQFDAVFQQVLRSFAPLTDARALNVQPNRIAIVRTTATMTLEQFNQRYPSVIPLADIAIINQIADPRAPIPAGTTLKRVVEG